MTRSREVGDLNAADTERLIVALAHEQLQVNGYAGLHYGELAKSLSISRAAIHHYFPAKVDLARRVIRDYCDWTRGRLNDISTNMTQCKEKLSAYVALYRLIIEQGDERLCPGGMLAAEAMTLPAELRNEVREFFALHVGWVAKEIFWRLDGPQAHAEATRAVASLQGALLVSRLFQDPEALNSSEKQLLDICLGEQG